MEEGEEEGGGRGGKGRGGGKWFMQSTTQAVPM